MNIDLDILLSLCNKKDMPILVGYKTFLNHISEFKNIETYKYHHAYYRSFIPFMEKEHLEKISQLDNLIILKYIDYCKNKGNKNSTINKKIGSLKYMLNYLEKMQLIDKPKINIEKLPNDEERYKDLTKDQIFKILEFSRTLEPKRHLQILLFLFTGIRRTELCHILLENIKPDYIVLTHTKNKKPRNIYLNEEMIELIEEIKKENKVYLFENMKHTEYENPRTLENLFKAIEDKTGIHTSPHCLRHTFATQLLEKGADLESIRLLLGHSDYSMIMRYVHIKNKRLAEMSTNLYDLERMDKQVQ